MLDGKGPLRGEPDPIISDENFNAKLLSVAFCKLMARD